MSTQFPRADVAEGGDRRNEKAVRLQDVVKEFDGGRVKALRGVSLEVPRGERLVLLGLSGSGKSTMMRLLNGLAQPTDGQVEVLSQHPAQMRERELRRFRRRIGFIFQHFNLVGRLSAIENVMIGGLGGLRGPRYGVMMYPDEQRHRAVEALERVGLGPQVFQRANTLSGGQQQRVGIARALFQEPEIVLADEPVASLDPESSRQVMELLIEVCDEQGLTVICSLHQVELARDWADRMVGLRGGVVVADSPPHQLSTDDLREVYRGRETEQS